MRRVALVLAVLFVATPAAAAPIAFGIQTPQESTSWRDLRALWQEAERLGYASAWVYDHFVPIRGSGNAPVLEGWTALAALAAATERIRVGVLVTGNTYRNPALLAKMATTVDHVSGGRLDFGIGAAWHAGEHEAYGFEFGTARERAQRLDEALQVITRLWTETAPSFQGRYYRLVEAPFAPAPVQKPHPPIVIGGQGKQWIMPLVARYADQWNVPLGITPDGIRERMALVRAECARVERTPCDVAVSVFLVLVSITDVPLAGPATRLGARLLYDERVARSVLAGSADAIAAKIQEYVDAGASSVILSLRPPFDRDLMARFMREVAPKVRAAESRS